MKSPNPFFFIIRTAKDWKRLSMEDVEPVHLQVFKTNLDKALSNLISSPS